MYEESGKGSRVAVREERIRSEEEEGEGEEEKRLSEQTVLMTPLINAGQQTKLSPKLDSTRFHRLAVYNVFFKSLTNPG